MLCIRVREKEKNIRGVMRVSYNAKINSNLGCMQNKFAVANYIPENFNIIPSFFTKYFLNCIHVLMVGVPVLAYYRAINK